MGASARVSARVLVTGASGFIGRQALAHLLAAGHEVHALARTPHADAGITWHRVNLLQRREVDDVMLRVRPSHLLHLAWYVEPHDYLRSLANLEWVGATLHLAEAFAGAGGRRLVAVGTSAEYAATSQPCAEQDTRLAPATLYAACKRAVSDVLTQWAPQVGVSVAWGRVFYLYGPGEHATRLVPQLIRAGMTGVPLALRSPLHVRDYMHVSDVAAALAALLESSVSGPVNIASGTGVVLADLARQVGACLGRDVPLDRTAQAPDDYSSIVGDGRRLREEVGFSARYPLGDGLSETVEWWKARTNVVTT